MNWENEFRLRMAKFKRGLPFSENTIDLSIKIRVVSGCYHREHSPNAYQIIDEYLHANPSLDYAIEEHESGPELLVWLALTTAGINITANVINLVTAIIKARTEGIKRGDRPNQPLELIVRGFDDNGQLWEEKVLRIDSWHEVNRDLIEKTLLNSTNNMFPKIKKGHPRKATSK